MHHGAATTICKKGEEEEQGEGLGWTSGNGVEAVGGMVVATHREQNVITGQRDTQMKVWRESSRKSLRRQAGR